MYVCMHEHAHLAIISLSHSILFSHSPVMIAAVAVFVGVDYVAGEGDLETQALPRPLLD